MPSPFPGMDPYLEDDDLWSDVHGTLLPLIRAEIRGQLPPGYTARIDQHVWLRAEDPDDRMLLGRPDFHVGGVGSTTTAAPRMMSVCEPTEYVELARLKRRRGTRYIELIYKRKNRVVTVIELLSYSNKTYGTEDQSRYLKKRIEYLGTGTNLVEIDLLRAGDRVPMGDRKGSPADYYVLVSRADEFPKAMVWGFTVRDPIPTIPVPLKPEHGSVALDLRRCLDAAYDSADYGVQIDYGSPPVPGLRQSDAEWAAALLAKPAKKKKK